MYSFKYFFALVELSVVGSQGNQVYAENSAYLTDCFKKQDC